MNFVEYQHEAMKTADYPFKGNNLLYPSLKLAGESGEAADKIGKWWRNNFSESPLVSGKDLNEEQTHLFILELGDVLWYLAALSQELGVSLESVADQNIKKLHDRQNRGVIKSEGDIR